MSRERHEFDPRLNPILSRVLNIHSLSIENNREKFLHDLTELADSLIPHARNHNDTLSIADFVPMDAPVEISKKQFWYFEVIFNKGQEDETMCEVMRTDLWSGYGVGLHIQTFKGGEKIGEIHFSNRDTGYGLTICAPDEKGEWGSAIVLDKRNWGLGKKPWTVVFDQVAWTPVESPQVSNATV